MFIDGNTAAMTPWEEMMVQGGFAENYYYAAQDGIQSLKIREENLSAVFVISFRGLLYIVEEIAEEFGDAKLFNWPLEMRQMLAYRGYFVHGQHSISDIILFQEVLSHRK